MEYEIGHTIKKENIQLKRLKKIIYSIDIHSSFSILDVRKIDQDDNTGRSGEAVIVECLNHEVSANSEIDIRYKENLAIICWENDNLFPAVQTLRKDFPETLHRYCTLSNEPKELCLYDQPWSDVKITWTPQLFLNRILWWMKKSSKNNLHQVDQALEQVFYHTGSVLIVPKNLELKNNEVWFIDNCSQNPTTMKMIKLQKSELASYRKNISNDLSIYHPLVIEAEPQTQSPINNPPQTLGGLHKHLESIGVNLWEKIIETIQDRFRAEPILDQKRESLLLFVTFPVRRDDTSDIEITGRQYAFLLCRGMGDIGLENDILLKRLGANEKGLTPIALLSQSIDWKKEPIVMANIISEVTVENLRTYNKVQTFPAENPTLIGCGSLGSLLLNQWLRMGWTSWTLVDNDTFFPHNTARHILPNFAVGFKKAESMRRMANTILPEANIDDVKALIIDATEGNSEFEDALNTTDLIVDVSTSLAVPRLLSQKDTARSISIFITPSGNDSVLLLEDSNRKLKLHQIEAQYYNWVINNEAGELHLSGHIGQIRYGGGCRDISSQIPFSSLNLHGGILSHQLINMCNKKEATAQVWQLNNDTGGVTTHSIELSQSNELKIKGWTVIWGNGIIKKAQCYRKRELPNETGGIIVGYIDHESNIIFLVDIRKAPIDSISTPKSFQRGIQGVSEDILLIKKRSAHIATYIGEWHSHPDSVLTLLTDDDRKQLKWMHNELSIYGQPGLVLIVGESEFNFYVKGDIGENYYGN
jgi:integrative and conjugative element protein (TIGR02256 family)